jgi:hypothetical protein
MLTSIISSISLYIFTYAKKTEPCLTFLNIHQLKRQGSDILGNAEKFKDLN